MDSELILLAITELVAFLLIIGGVIYSVIYLRRQIQRSLERKKAKQQSDAPNISGATEATEMIGGLFYLALGLGLIFVIGIVILAIIKWSFGVVFG